MTTAVFLALLAGVVLAVRERAHRRDLERLRHELAAATAALSQRSKPATVDEIVSGLAQELKTPLQDVLANTELMLATSGDGEPASEELRQIHEGAERAAGIIRNLVAFTETVSLTCRWQDVNDIVDRAIVGVRSELQARSVRVDRAPFERMPMTYIDGRQLEKVVAAFIARPARVAEALAAPIRPDRPFVVTVNVKRVVVPSDRVLVTIEDNGPDPVSEAQGFGAGGLAVSRQVVQAHGGSLTAGSRSSGSGMRTLIELPITGAASQESPTWTESSISLTSIANGISTS